MKKVQKVVSVVPVGLGGIYMKQSLLVTPIDQIDLFFPIQFGNVGIEKGGRPFGNNHADSRIYLNESKPKGITLTLNKKDLREFPAKS